MQYIALVLLFYVRKKAAMFASPSCKGSEMRVSRNKKMYACRGETSRVGELSCICRRIVSLLCNSID